MTLKTLAEVTTSPDGKTWLRLDERDRAVSERITSEAKAKGKRVRVEISLERKRRTNAQNALYWATLPTLFLMVHGQHPTREELEDFHEDFKAVHGLRRPSVLDPKVLVPVRLRDADSQDAKVLLDALFVELAEHAASSAVTAQSAAREAWRAYWDDGGPVWADEAAFREVTLCAACAKGGVIQLAHIVSRGADPARKADPLNWLPLCHDCHREQHQHGWDRFLTINPHLATRVRAAQKETA